MFTPSSFQPSLALVLGIVLVGGLSGCGGEGDAVEFSSEVKEEELGLGDLLMQGEGGGSLGNAGQGESATSLVSAADAGVARQSVHYFSPGFARPFAMVQFRLFESFVREAEGPSIRIYDGKDNAALQETALLAVIEIGAKGIVLFPVDPVLLRDEVARALEVGIPVVVIGASKEELPGTVNLPIDYHQAGEMAAEFVVERLKIKSQKEGATEVTGEIIEITGTDDLRTDTGRQINAGFTSVIGRYPGVRIVHRAPGSWGEMGGADRSLEGIRIQEGANVIFCHNDAMAIGAYLAVREEGKESDFLIVGVDGVGGPDGGIASVREQLLAATIAVPLLSKEAAETLLALVEGKKDAPSVEEVPVELVTIANSFEMYRRHTARPVGE